MAVADLGFGAEIGFGTSTVKSEVIGVLSMNWTGMTTADIQTSHLTTSGDAHTFIPADLCDGGTLEVEAIFDPDEDITSLMGVSQTITLTYPLPAGKLSEATAAFTGYINGYDHAIPMEEMMTATISIKVAGDVTYTAAA